jgi:hypothetical protein
MTFRAAWRSDATDAAGRTTFGVADAAEATAARSAAARMTLPAARIASAASGARSGRGAEAPRLLMP